ncbi:MULTISPECIES: polysaccharide pyruvyl transferase family protein [unclassified Enterococcus]|uniref:polysaccharide pyruvyl transferase family protein n=1 Tax=unclassified Enterococcus TaxID=2608891 RepID=UPI0015519DF6|nr:MULTISPECIES: polysaccharide pyruvyl transferase family protein [unclassified Enterococcus]MBS7577279.1 polysaccharide pyruvyl transferase family protein [Enterococcus sp. MMGLQ5-2]MBS7584628.1 polysaccharide pyruvyl transferase family protein [Enterococcus sp. MMGLQ5-1]NPD12483.1 polysaccharide pyruvyl transferase family protein [Enterococcus sp. MMGLQ5-1]NPD37113.1 polysaccharide pyruvyl transferase family protein [Enterococcus sp. MMGLQ5-2]
MLKKNFDFRYFKIKYLNSPIKLWQYREPGFINFGDELGADIIQRLFRKKVELYASSSIDNHIKYDLISVGSILDFFMKVDYPLNIWGSGMMLDYQKTEDNNNLTFHAVRGEITRKQLGSKWQNIALGDPGLLCSLIYTNEVEKLDKIGIILHFSDEKQSLMDKVNSESEKYLLISVKQEPEKVADLIKQCKLILSSSLHGLIVADSFGIPNIHVPLSNLNGNGGKYGNKFLDYYSAIGKDYQFLAADLIFDAAAHAQVITNYQKISTLKDIQEKLINSFPY